MTCSIKFLYFFHFRQCTNIRLETRERSSIFQINIVCTKSGLQDDHIIGTALLIIDKVTVRLYIHMYKVNVIEILSIKSVWHCICDEMMMKPPR